MNAKTVRTIILSLMFVINLICITRAETEHFTTDLAGFLTYDETSGMYTASYNGAIAGKEYVLLVVRSSADESLVINTDTIVYADQKTANESEICFEFRPMWMPDCKVLLAGDFGITKSHVVLGTLIAYKVTVTGRVHNATAPIVQLGFGDRDHFVASYTATVDDNGTFIFRNVPSGEYALQISQAYHITYHKERVTVNSENFSLGESFAIYPGDIVPDGAINFADLSLLINCYGSSVTSDSPADINGDNIVDSEDLSILLSNYDIRAADIAE